MVDTISLVITVAPNPAPASTLLLARGLVNNNTNSGNNDDITADIQGPDFEILDAGEEEEKEDIIEDGEDMGREELGFSKGVGG